MAFVDAAYRRVAIEHGEVDAVLVVAVAEAGRAHREGHDEGSVHSGRMRYGRQFASLQIFHADRAVRISRFEELRGLQREVSPITVTAGGAVYQDFELSACHCAFTDITRVSFASKKLIVGGGPHFPVKRSLLKVPSCLNFISTSVRMVS